MYHLGWGAASDRSAWLCVVQETGLPLHDAQWAEPHREQPLPREEEAGQERAYQIAVPLPHIGHGSHSGTHSFFGCCLE